MNYVVMTAALVSGLIAIPAYIPSPTTGKLIIASAAQLVSAVVLGAYVPSEPDVNLWVGAALLVAHGGFAAAKVIIYLVEKYQVKTAASEFLG